MGDLKYKVGDKVRVKSLDWYNNNKDEYGYVHCGDKVFDNYMSVFCGSVVTIGGIYPYNGYDIREDIHSRTWTDEMIEGLVEEEIKPKFKVGDKVRLDTHPCIVTDITWRDSLHGFVYTVRGFDFGKMVGERDLIFDTSEEEVDLIPKFGEYSDNKPLNISTMTTDFIKEHGFPCPDGYQFVDENGNVINATKIVLEKKKGEYPKTFMKCCDVLSLGGKELSFFYKKGYKQSLIENFRKLLIYRDAYWKLAGDEMGLGKPWEPDWDDDEIVKYCIIVDSGTISKQNFRNTQFTLAFPTAEMRDAFYENFKSEIEIGKEFL